MYLWEPAEAKKPVAPRMTGASVVHCVCRGTESVPRGCPSVLAGASQSFEFDDSPHALAGHQRGIMFVAFSPDARIFASASLDKSVKLWDGRTAK